jgi:hypothetical protein
MFTSIWYFPQVFFSITYKYVFNGVESIFIHVSNYEWFLIIINMNSNVVSTIGLIYNDGCIGYYGFDMKNQMKQTSMGQCYETLMQCENIGNITIDKIWPIYVQVGSQFFFQF